MVDTLEGWIGDDSKRRDVRRLKSPYRYCTVLVQDVTSDLFQMVNRLSFVYFLKRWLRSKFTGRCCKIEKLRVF
jgi:hypothetical protein